MMIKCKGTNGQKLFFKEEILSVEYYFYTLVRVKNHCFAFESAVTGRRLLEKQAMNYLNIIVLQSHQLNNMCEYIFTSPTSLPILNMNPHHSLIESSSQHSSNMRKQPRYPEP